ncbi:MAG TPA: biotin carboxylase N-terminal domain-containing protein [Candidatus Limnocylindria bacterium]|nr:biotin carboxylase N-terminal domain-containing protein [Candidatus Limnocylindria bacterium]
MTDDDLTPRQVAEQLGVTVRTVQRWINDGRLPAERVGGRMRVSRSSLARVASAPPAGIGTRAAASPIHSVLIANRGEIAVRIARTASRLGIRTIGVHEAGDRPPDGIDLVIPVGSYLDGEGILDAARRSGAEAIHPGYGFLAENAGFAHAVAEAGLAWVGPPADAIAAMGDKAAARRRAAAAGVQVLAGYDDEAQDDATLLDGAARVGLPLLVKPAAGGGGKGMHVVRDAADLPDALAAARREASRAFGDDRLILERLLDGPRHVEVQVLFDRHGRGVHLGERDCSAQRRHQKIVEESPAPAVDAALRDRMGEAALTVAAAVGYEGAGTVEFLLDDAGGFHFLEMNTRLQVEHPVTEAVTGRDLVADQLRIAAGEPLDVDQARFRFAGHAIEARLYAEDPAAGFLPATGRVVGLQWPAGVRVDTGIHQGDEVTDRYDPLLAKLIVQGPDRSGALAALQGALAATRLLGVRTNLAYLRWLIEQPAMRDGAMRTDTIDQMALPEPPVPDHEDWSAAAAGAAAGGLLPGDVWGGGWRSNAQAAVRLRHDQDERRVEFGRAAPPVDRVAVDLHARAVHLDVGGQSLGFAIADAPTVDEAVRHAASHAEGHAALVAPMPGRVVAVRVAGGASVAAHATVVVIEAMKMEHAVTTPIAGVVGKLAVREGDQVQRGDVLAEVMAEVMASVDLESPA